MFFCLIYVFYIFLQSFEIDCIVKEVIVLIIMIVAIIIENFKSIKELTLEFKRINILIGANGAGKSNLIGFFKLLDAMYKNELKHYVAVHGYADSFLYFGRKVSNFTSGDVVFAPVVEDSQTGQNWYHYDLIPNQSNHLIIESEDSHNFEEVKTLDYESYFLATTEEKEVEQLREQFKTFVIYHFHDTSVNAALRTPCQLKDNRVLREDGSNLAAFLYFLKERHPSNFKFITRTIQSIAPFFKGFLLEPDNLNPDMITLEWEEKGSNLYLNAQNLSDGTLRFIALATLLLQPNPPSTIIIDEPELGLHPFAINKLAGLIKKVSAKSQVILSTQSVNLVSNFEPEDLITVDRVDKQSVFQRLDSEALEQWLEDYSLGDLWTKSVIGGQP